MSRANKNTDPVHIQQTVFDAEAEANRVVIVSDIQLALDAKEDSIVAVKRSVKVQDETVDCSGMNKICLFGEGKIYVSPDSEGDEFYDVGAISERPQDICAKRVKVVGKAVMHG